MNRKCLKSHETEINQNAMGQAGKPVFLSDDEKRGNLQDPINLLMLNKNLERILSLYIDHTVHMIYSAQSIPRLTQLVR